MNIIEFCILRELQRMYFERINRLLWRRKSTITLLLHNVKEQKQVIRCQIKIAL